MQKNRYELKARAALRIFNGLNCDTLYKFQYALSLCITTCDDDFIGSAGSAPMTLADGSTVTTETPAATETLTGNIGDISSQTNDSFSLTDTNGGMTDTSAGGGTFTAGDASTEGDLGIAAVSIADSTLAEPMTSIEIPAPLPPAIP